MGEHRSSLVVNKATKKSMRNWSISAGNKGWGIKLGDILILPTGLVLVR